MSLPPAALGRVTSTDPPGGQSVVASEALSRLRALAGSFERALATLNLEISVLTDTEPRADLVGARETAIRILAIRERLRAHSGEAFFMDVSFDILLDIFANQSIDRPLGVTDICAGSRMPQTSVRRWIQKLEHIAIVKRQGDPDDHRRDLMSLAPLIFATLAKMLAAPST